MDTPAARIAEKTNHTERFEERRKHGRLSACGDAFAMIEPLSKVLGQIIDISMGGLSIRYIPSQGSSPGGKTVSGLRILLADHSFYFDTMPCRMVSIENISKHEFGFSLVPMKRQSFQFLGLSAAQKGQLEYFLRNHTKQDGESRGVGFERQ